MRAASAALDQAVAQYNEIIVQRRADTTTVRAMMEYARNPNAYVMCSVRGVVCGVVCVV